MLDNFKEIGIPKKYLRKTNKEDRFAAVVSKLWIKHLIKHSKLTEFIEKPNFQAWPVTEEDVGPSWIKVLISCLPKRECKVFPLPKVRSSKDDAPFLFSQLMQYISQTNYNNLWKKAHKKYMSTDSHRETKITLTDYNAVLREIITRIYGCPIINSYDESLNVGQSAQFDVHLNIYPAVCAVETPKAIFLFHLPYMEYNISDCLTFSPAILEKSYTKSLFIIYQILNVLKSLHERSLTLGEITLKDIFISEDMWVYVFPQVTSNFFTSDSSTNKSNYECTNAPICNNYQYFSSHLYDKVQLKNESLSELCQLWINGWISNFTYISALNKLSGRVIGDPNCHYVFPWVTDFSSTCGKNWRDLKKSKYRLNKGDHQLDLTYDNSQSQIPHHVSDVLSPITYYVYMARTTPKSVLCKNVRTIWVPAEYPSSIQRIQEWTPDECIPEFYTDPSVFRSIHDDLDDLAVPSWASDPEEFIEIHRKALESPNVSEKLHYWIDLTFGYKLSGHPAVRARNVCLNLADDHENLTKSGLVQLFTHPHPLKAVDSPYFGKTPPKLFIGKLVKPRSRGRSNSSIQEPITSDEERYSYELPSRMLSRSRSSLYEEPPRSTRSSSTQRCEINNPNRVTEQAQGAVSDVIYLPKDYKPEFLLDSLEKRDHFFSKTFCRNYTDNIPNVKPDAQYALVQNAFTNMMFSENLDDRSRQRSPKLLQQYQKSNQSDCIVTCNYIDIISSRRIKELKVLGCLILEIFMAKQLRPVGSTGSNVNLENRLAYCLSIFSRCDIPPCISYIVNLLLQPEKEEYSAVTDMGLPPPSASLLLEPLMHCTVPFSKHFPYLYELLRNLKEFKSVAIELNILYHFDCDGHMCSEYENIEKTKILFAQNIAECKVKMCAKQLDILLDEIDTNTDNEVVNIILPHIKELIEDPPTSVLAAWYLFEPISRVLGPQKTSKYLLEPILKLYENECVDTHLPYIKKIAKLYHHSFLLCLMVRLGLKTFLENFVVPLVEAVGGYKDYDLVEFVLHNHIEKIVKRGSHLKTIESEQMDISGGDISRVLGPQKTSKYLLEPILKLYENECVDTHLPYIKKIAKLYHHSFLLCLMVRLGLKTFLENFVVPLVEAVGGYKDYDLVEFVLHNHIEKIVKRGSHLKTIESEQMDISGGDDSGSNDNHSKGLSGSFIVNEEIFEIEEEKNDEDQMKFLMEHLQLNVSSELPFNHSFAEEAVETTEDNVNLILHLEDELNDSPEALKSPTIPIPQSQHNHVNNITCEVGSKKSENEFTEQSVTPNSQKFESQKTKSSTKISDMSADSLVWLSHRLGPLLTAKYLSRNLLKMLALCYIGKDNISPFVPENVCSFKDISITSHYVKGDQPTVKVLECLTNISGLYGEQIIIFQYIPYMTELVLLCKKRITVNLEGGLISCVTLLKNIIPYITDSMLMNQLQDVILKSIINPIIRLLNSTNHVFPSGSTARNTLARKYLDVIYILAIRIGVDMTKKYLLVPSLQRFFLIFDKVFTNSSEEGKVSYTLADQESVVEDTNIEDDTKNKLQTNIYIMGLCFRLVASCDSIVHIWDPFMGANVGSLESPKFAPVNTLKSMPAPSTLVFAATTDGTIKILDTRVLNYMQELKISNNPTSLIRCLAVAPSGNWVAAGQSSGNITILDTRTGFIIANWRAHESEVLQLQVYDKDTLVSSSLDQTTSVWNVLDGRLKFHMRGTTEPVHCLSIHNNELISGTTGNRIGVHTSITFEASFSNNKLRGDSFRGLLTSMDYLPLNRLLLLGADTGNINLLC
uniref:WD repeat-containing protein 81-like n=1 Tax=Diabrotica virgifera virgifera TaxID=50390 RepID=A0A6P7G0N8_DIAVI